MEDWSSTEMSSGPHACRSFDLPAFRLRVGSTGSGAGSGVGSGAAGTGAAGAAAIMFLANTAFTAAWMAAIADAESEFSAAVREK